MGFTGCTALVTEWSYVVEARPTWRNFWTTFLGIAFVDLILHYKGLRAGEWLPALLGSLARGLTFSILILVGMLAYSRDKKPKDTQQISKISDSNLE
jgi:hypothetical protein